LTWLKLHNIYVHLHVIVLKYNCWWLVLNPTWLTPLNDTDYLYVVLFYFAICNIVFCFFFFIYLQTVSVTVSVMTLTSISIDRWYAICHPLKFKSTTSRARTAIIIIWIVGLASGNKIINSIWYRKGNDDSSFYRSDPYNTALVYERDDFF
jgi:hypothetical protein